MRAKVWTEPAWDADCDIRTVWIIRDTKLHEGLIHCTNSEDVQVLSLFADEAHTAFRSMSSQRAKVFRTIARFADFVVLISGTMFPLGPKEDAAGIMMSLGGTLRPDSQNSKFDVKSRRIMEKLFSHGGWNVLAFRVMITPFHLSRNIDSTWYGKFIIDRTIARPRPIFLLPFDDPTTAHLASAFRNETRKKNRDGMIDIGALRLRSNEMKYNAWCPLWSPIASSIRGDSGSSRSHAMEEILNTKFPRTRPSGRIRKLVSLIKCIVNAGERFVIVTDRIWLALLAMKVRLHSITLMDRHVSP